MGNHTYHHPDMSQISTMETFREELETVEEAFESATGEKMTKILPAAAGNLQYPESVYGQRDGISYLLLESCLCGLVSG